MGLVTGISWCHHTHNAWWGCTKVSDGCKWCYAETWDARFGGDHWGPGKPRRITSRKNRNAPLKWDRMAAAAGERRRVFCSSMSDVFDDEGPADVRADLWTIVEHTRNLDWLLLTKRPENILSMIPPTWKDKPCPNVWYGTSVEDNRVIDRIDILRQIPAAVRFLSVEPMIGPVDFPTLEGIHWVIYGGESQQGKNPAREMKEEWVRDGMKVCRKFGAAVFLKQMGTVWAKAHNTANDKGEDINEWPEDLRVQEFPGAPYALTEVYSSEPMPVYGKGSKQLTVISEDNDHLADFKDYM